MRFNLRVYRESVNRDTNRRRFTAGRHRRTMSVIVALIMMTALVAPNIAGAAGAVPFSGEDPATGTRTVTIADITDFHGHIEHGADVAVVPEFLRTLVFARPRGDDQFADCTFSPSLDMSR